MHFVHPDPLNPKYATETTGRDAKLLIVGREEEQQVSERIKEGKQESGE